MTETENKDMAKQQSSEVKKRERDADLPPMERYRLEVGERDGVKVGWVMSIGGGGKFIARLRIISVDIDRSTGIVELEDPNKRGSVQEGQQVLARTPQ